MPAIFFCDGRTHFRLPPRIALPNVGGIVSARS
jgi:hypothetical protein